VCISSSCAFRFRAHFVFVRISFSCAFCFCARFVWCVCRRGLVGRFRISSLKVRVYHEFRRINDKVNLSTIIHSIVVETSRFIIVYVSRHWQYTEICTRTRTTIKRSKSFYPIGHWVYVVDEKYTKRDTNKGGVGMEPCTWLNSIHVYLLNCFRFETFLIVE
jgi:hypothetical protein